MARSTARRPRRAAREDGRAARGRVGFGRPRAVRRVRARRRRARRDVGRRRRTGGARRGRRRRGAAGRARASPASVLRPRVRSRPPAPRPRARPTTRRRRGGARRGIAGDRGPPGRRRRRGRFVLDDRARPGRGRLRGLARVVAVRVARGAGARRRRGQRNAARRRARRASRACIAFFKKTVPASSDAAEISRKSRRLAGRRTSEPRLVVSPSSVDGRRGRDPVSTEYPRRRRGVAATPSSRSIRAAAGRAVGKTQAR